MKLIRRTYSIAPQEYEEAQQKADERGKSLSRLIRDYLVSLPRRKK